MPRRVFVVVTDGRVRLFRARSFGRLDDEVLNLSAGTYRATTHRYPFEVDVDVTLPAGTKILLRRARKPAHDDRRVVAREIARLAASDHN